MRRLTGSLRQPSGQGFTLVELLLVVVLVMLLFGAVIFNFSSLTDHAVLDEAATRLETLFRFARAHAANTGRQVRVVFDESSGTNSAAGAVRIRLEWEPDPLGEPGVFAAVEESALQADDLLERVRIESVELGNGSAENAPKDETMSEADTLLLDELSPDLFPAIAFFPDGSSDSATIVLTEPETEKPRQLRLHLNGLTGATTRETISESGYDEFGEPIDVLAAEETAR
jgi:type II secretory pathway pseudopilin PulG